MADTPEVAQAFLPDGGREQEGASQGYLGVDQRPAQRQEGGQTAPVVADAGTPKEIPLPGDRDVGARRKHGVEMGGHHHRWALDRAGIGVPSHDVAFSV